MLKTEELSVEGIKQFYLDCTSEAQKFEVLVQLYSLLTVGQSIIFVQVCCSKPYPSSLLTHSRRKE
jgi:superfamily II DNA/RNA helicase